MFSYSLGIQCRCMYGGLHCTYPAAAKCFFLVVCIPYLLLGTPLPNEKVDNSKVLQSLPVADVLQFGIIDTEI